MFLYHYYDKKIGPFANCEYIKISIEEFNLKTVSFTYGDSHPTFSI